MQQTTDVPVPQQSRRIFYVATIFLLLVAVALAFIQKQHESAVAIAYVKGGNVQLHIQEAQRWFLISLVAVATAICSCGIALYRREKHRRTWVLIVVLLVLYVGLQLIIV